jgi:ribosomal protein L29
MEEEKDTKVADAQTLERLLAQERAALRAFRFQLAGGKLKNNRSIREARKRIARILTRACALRRKSKAASPVSGASI